MTDHAQTRFWSGIDIPKTLAGTLAAVSAAVAGSFLGIAGTLIGAAVAALISSIGTEIYHRSIDRGTKKLQAAFVAAPAAVGTPEVAAAPEPPSAEHGPPRQIRWKHVSLVAAALFVLALGSLTAVELMAGRSAADTLTGRDGHSAPSLVNNSRSSGGDSSDQDKVTPAPSDEPASEAPETPETAQPEPSTPAESPQPQTTRQETADPTETTTQPEQNETGGDGEDPQQPAQEPAQQEGS